MAEDKGEKSPRKLPSKQLCHICNKYICGSSYFLKAHLYQHKEVEPRFNCPFCSRQYFRRDVYNKHLEVHTGRRKVYVCDYCDRGFVDKRNLISHLNVHEDRSYITRQKYDCKACGAQYCEERLLKYHIRKEHFNLQEKEKLLDTKPLNETWVEKVLESDVCVQMTKINNNVITIQKCSTVKEESGKMDKDNQFVNYINSVFGNNDKSQYSKAVCDYCNKQMLKKSLLNHIRERHLNIRKFKCEECKRSFKRQYQMTDHLCGRIPRRGLKGFIY